MEDKEWDEDTELRCKECGGDHGPTLLEMAYGELRYHERVARREPPDDSYLQDTSGVY